MQRADRQGNPNVRAARFLLVGTTAHCRHCGLRTRLFAIALEPGHRLIELDETTDDDAVAADTWTVANGPALLFHVDWIDPTVDRRLRQIAPSFRPGDTDDAGAAGWCNHCERCGVPQQDDDLHCEPGAAFLPVTEADASRIRRISIDLPFEAEAAGYCPDPPFFDALS